MTNPSKKPTPNIAEKKERVRKAVRILGEALDNYEKAHPHWKIEVLVSLIKWSVKCLKHYIEDARDKEITWEQPFVELRYPVEWDWKTSRTRGDEHGSILYGNVTDTNVAEKTIAVETLSRIMARAMNARALGDLTNWVRLAKRGHYHTPCLPLELAEALDSIKAKGMRQEAYERIARPFSIGAASVDYGTDELRDGQHVSAKAAKQLAKLSDFIDIPHIGFSGDVNGRKIEMSLVFQIHPLVTDQGEEKAYHPITVGLHIVPKVSGNEVFFENPAEWPKKGRGEFWKELFQALEGLADKLIPREESEDSVILMVNAQLKVPASCWKPESRGNVMKAITDALSLGGEVSQINVQTEGARNELRDRPCPVCGFAHDHAFTQILVPGHASITIAGALPDIVRCVHTAHEKGLPYLSTKDDDLLRRCGGYGHPSKAFHDLRQSGAYKVLFDTSRRGFIALRGFGRKES
jgi:hypothetical protein